MTNFEIIDKINNLKKEKNAVILAHNYQIPEIQDIADFVGDSFRLSQQAAQTKADIIVFCGVHFMAESAKILSPNKKVLLPAKDAGCPMADMIDKEQLKEFKRKNPGIPVVCYVNSSAEVKAESDICCTSSNAVKVVKSLKSKKVLFVPDQNLGNYISKQVPNVEIINWEGFCITHKRVKEADIDKVRQKKPAAKILVHPECNPEVVERSDFVGSTSQIIEFCNNSSEEEFIIGTEMGIIHTLKKQNPNKSFYLLSQSLICTNMKKTNLYHVYESLLYDKYEITVNDEITLKAYQALEKMLKIS